MIKSSLNWGDKTNMMYVVGATKANHIETIKGNRTENITGDVSETVGGNVTEAITGNLEIDAARIDFN